MTKPLFAAALALASLATLHAEPRPLKALLIAGGCCHDYEHQQEILSKGIQARANVEVDVVWTDDKSTTPKFPLYEKVDWAAGYDVVIHDECAAGVKDLPLVQNIIRAHEKIPAVNLHCAMHCYRTGTDDWFKYLGLQSSAHNWQKPIGIKFVDPEHPITKGLSDWTTIQEELYNNIQILGGHAIATGAQPQKQKDGSMTDQTYVVAWTNDYKGTRIFSTTIGHNNETVADARYLDLVTRGLLWACDKLTPDYLTPFQGQNKVTFIKGAPQPSKPEQAKAPTSAPKDATLVQVTASSTQGGNQTWKAVDNNPETRWCASDASYPQWIQLELDKPHALEGIRIQWEGNSAYQYTVEGSPDGKAWILLADDAKNEQNSPRDEALAKAAPLKFVRINGLGSKHGWCSIREISLKGDGIKTLWPANQEAKAEAAKTAADANDPYAKGGNIKPEITQRTPEEEKAILADATGPEGFEMTLFAAPPAVNYPVFISAALDGTLYVSSDGNGSTGRQPDRGRILRLRDTKGDGRATEVKEFVKSVDSPRGLVWDHDRLYLIHPPDVSVYIDKKGEGVASEEHTLIKGIAFGFADRPADHTTNGLSIGVDGYLYIAGGDFGFMDAVGTDGRHLRHRGGGVIRFRPDGSGLELVSHGTRNILEVAVGPLMNMFARDNTNDGDGWDVRFHHFTGLENHGYPVFYKNFSDEEIAPLNDYGGGAGCGAVFLDEPGFGKWNNAPLTADWGTGALWHHSVQQKGSTYIETEKPQPFIKMTRPTDADVDGLSHLFQASWKGSTFNWAGPNVGYIVRVSPKGFKPEPLPDFDHASDEALVKLLESPSHRTRLESQRTLLRRPETAATNQRLLALAADKSKPLATRVVAMYGVSQRNVESPDAARIKAVAALAAEDAIHPYVLLALGDSGLASKQNSPSLVPADLLGAGMNSRDAQTRLNAMIAAVRQRQLSLATDIARLLGDDDAVISHTAPRALWMLQAPEPCFAVLDYPGSTPAQRESALRSLRMMHTKEVVDGLLQRLAKTSDFELRKGYLAALARLHFIDGEWQGNSWGTRPDYRGPYYQPDPWSETDRIAAALKEALAKASPAEAAFLVSELNRNRIQFNEALQRILTLAKSDPKLIPDAVSQLATAESIPSDAVPLLIQAAGLKDAPSTVLQNAVTALAKVDSADGCRASLEALAELDKIRGVSKERDAARAAFLGAPKLENYHQLFEELAAKVNGPTALWSDAALLTLSARKTGAPEPRELSAKALDAGWQDLHRRAQILAAAGEIKHGPYADKILASLDDPDKAVAAAAKSAAGKMRLEKKTAQSGPLIGALSKEQAIAQILKSKGDVALGEQLFTRQTCVTCHTTSQDQPQKGPYLGNIAQTYKRPELAENILDPNKTIAQGFTTNLITLKDGTVNMGFVTRESADKVTIRNVAAQEFTYALSDIAKRETLPTSMMPVGLVNNLTVREFASLLDYLEALAKK